MEEKRSGRRKEDPDFKREEDRLPLSSRFQQHPSPPVLAPLDLVDLQYKEKEEENLSENAMARSLRAAAAAASEEAAASRPAIGNLDLLLQTSLF